MPPSVPPPRSPAGTVPGGGAAPVTLRPKPGRSPTPPPSYPKTPHPPPRTFPAPHALHTTPIAPHPSPHTRPSLWGRRVPRCSPPPPVLFVTAVSLLPGDTRSTGGGGWHPRAEVPTGRGQRGLWGQWGIMGTVGDLGTYGDPRGDSGGAVVQWGQWSREVPTDAECPTGHGDPPGPPSSPPTLPCDPELQHSPPPPPNQRDPPGTRGLHLPQLGGVDVTPSQSWDPTGRSWEGPERGGRGGGVLGALREGPGGVTGVGGSQGGAGGELGVIPGQS